MQQKYYSVQHVAKRYDVSTGTVWRWVRRGTLPRPVQLSPGCTRWSGEQLDEADTKRDKQAAA